MTIATDAATAITDEAMALLRSGRQTTRFSTRYPGFDLRDAYAIADRMKAIREGRGEVHVARKLGFTNPAGWAGLGISAPMGNYLFDTTVSDVGAGTVFSLAGWPEPRIEAEVVVHLATAPNAGMDEDELAGCIDWIAGGFEIVSCIFPGWSFAPQDAIAGYSLHAGLLIGPRIPVTDGDELTEILGSISVELTGSTGRTLIGTGSNVMGSPLMALRAFVEVLATLGPHTALRAGEIVTTGTLTDAPGVAPGERWTAAFSGALGSIAMRFV